MERPRNIYWVYLTLDKRSDKQSSNCINIKLAKTRGNSTEYDWEDSIVIKRGNRMITMGIIIDYFSGYNLGKCNHSKNHLGSKSYSHDPDAPLGIMNYNFFAEYWLFRPK